MNSERGLVISCPVEIQKNWISIKAGGIDPQELRFALLFWDKLDFPSNNVIHVDHGPDEEFLFQAGVLNRTRIISRGAHIGHEFYRELHVSAFRHLDAQEPGTWSLAHGERSISFVDEDLENGRGALVKLHRALPVPDRDVPIADILDFRVKRRDELLALRNHLEDVYQRVLAAGDGALAWKAQIGRLEHAIASHIIVSKEAGFKLRNVSFDADLNLAAMVAPALVSVSQGLSAIETILNVTGSAIAVTAAHSLKGSKSTGTPFRYVSRYHEEIF